MQILTEQQKANLRTAIEKSRGGQAGRFYKPNGEANCVLAHLGGIEGVRVSFGVFLESRLFALGYPEGLLCELRSTYDCGSDLDALLVNGDVEACFAVLTAWILKSEAAALTVPPVLYTAPNYQEVPQGNYPRPQVTESLIQDVVAAHRAPNTAKL